VNISALAIANMTRKNGSCLKMNVEGARQLFPKELEDLLIFEDKGDFIKIVPRRYLGNEKFAKVAAIVRDKGGEYISAGRESHFKLPRTQTTGNAPRARARAIILSIWAVEQQAWLVLSLELAWAIYALFSFYWIIQPKGKPQ